MGNVGFFGAFFKKKLLLVSPPALRKCRIERWRCIKSAELDFNINGRGKKTLL